MTPLIALLAKELSAPLAKKLLESLTKGKNNGDKLEKATALINSGSTALAALQSAFGSDFEKAFSDIVRNGGNGWTYEAGRNEYIRLEKNELSAQSDHDRMRDELNLNLERLNRVFGPKHPEITSYMLGMFSVWKERYISVFGADTDEEKTFATISGLLDGKSRTARQALAMLQKAGFGTAGALLIVYAGLLATSTGVGLLGWFSAAIFGIPGVQIGALAIGGAALIALSRIKLSNFNATSVAIAAAYKLLERRAGKVQVFDQEKALN